jgi:hypothetical protein
LAHSIRVSVPGWLIIFSQDNFWLKRERERQKEDRGENGNNLKFNNVTCMSDCIDKRFIDRLYTHLVTTLYRSLSQKASVLSLLQSPLAVVWKRLSTADFPLTLGFRTIPCLNYQLLTTPAHND